MKKTSKPRLTLSTQKVHNLSNGTLHAIDGSPTGHTSIDGSPTGHTSIDGSPTGHTSR